MPDLVRTGQVLTRPSRDPRGAFEREIAALLAEGQREEAFGLTIGLAILTCEPVEVLWERATTTHELI